MAPASPAVDPAANVDLQGLDDPVGASLHGPHRHLARRSGRVAAYATDVSTFLALPNDPEDADWADLARLVGPGGFADLFSAEGEPPEGWEPIFRVDGVQMVGSTVSEPPEPDRAGPDVVVLGPDDLSQMLELVERTEPGPFRARTLEMGTYLGIRDGGRLVAMAGERLHPPGWTEISAVCTDPDARGRGYAGRLVRTLAARISARGERPFLHVLADNTPARRLYEALGFEVGREVVFRGFRVPADASTVYAEPLTTDGRIQLVRGGDLGCARLLILLRNAIRTLAPGTDVHLETTDPVAPIDLPAWCRMTGHAYLGPVDTEVDTEVDTGGAQAPRYAVRVVGDVRETHPDSPWRLAE